jgi:hypothetical protein
MSNVIKTRRQLRMNLHTASLIARGIGLVAAYVAMRDRSGREKDWIAFNRQGEDMRLTIIAAIKVIMFLVAISMISPLHDLIASLVHKN